MSGSGDGDLRLWSLDSATCTDVLHGHEDAVRCISVDWQKNRAVSGSRDHTIKVWNLNSGGVCLATLRGHQDAVWSLDVDWIRRCVLSGSKDSLMKCWDLDRGICM